jgi:hypothetical protein
VLSPDQFRRIALTMKDAVEGAHMSHPDFRANGRIFASLYPDHEWGMVKLTPEQQADYVRADSKTFVPASGAWGRQGCTSVRLESADAATIRKAVTLAYQNTAAKRAAGPAKARPPTKPKRPPRKR